MKTPFYRIVSPWSPETIENVVVVVDDESLNFIFIALPNASLNFLLPKHQDEPSFVAQGFIFVKIPASFSFVLRS